MLRQGGWWSRHRSPTCLHKLRRQYGLLCRKVNLDISRSAHTGVRSSSVRKKAQCLHLFERPVSPTVVTCRPQLDPPAAAKQLEAAASVQNRVEHVLAPLETRRALCFLELVSFHQAVMRSLHVCRTVPVLQRSGCYRVLDQVQLYCRSFQSQANRIMMNHVYNIYIHFVYDLYTYIELRTYENDQHSEWVSTPLCGKVVQ